MEVSTLIRKFTFNGVELADPGMALTPDQVKDFYSAVYPDITNAEIEGPEQKGNTLAYTFRRAVGTKGMLARADLLSVIATMAFDNETAQANRVPMKALNTHQARALGAALDSEDGAADPERLAIPAETLPLLP